VRETSFWAEKGDDRAHVDPELDRVVQVEDLF